MAGGGGGGSTVDPRDHTHTTDGAGPHRIRILPTTARRPNVEN
jgi:hypothetical protein